MESKIRLILLTITFLAAQTIAADSQDTMEALLNLSLEALIKERIKVGARGGDRTLLQSPVPIEVIHAEDIERSGFTELSKILEGLLPSFHLIHATINDGSDHMRPFTLRGMAPDQVLVLVNGKRRHPGALLHVNGTVGRGSTSVDLNAIPAKAIQRIEVLRDGAAAQYGSDAIAGIINIVLKSKVEAQVTATLGETARGDGTFRQVDISYGVALAEGGFFHFNAELRDRGFTNRSGYDTRQQYFDNDPRNEDPNLTNQITHRVGDADVQDVLFLFNAEFPLAQDAYWYGFGSLNYRESEAAGFFRRPLDNSNVRAIYPNGFLPLIAPEILDFSLAMGAKGESTSGWRWDISNLLGRNHFKFQVRDSVNASLGAASPTSFDAGSLLFTQNTLNIDLFKTLALGWTHSLDLALGTELRLEHFELRRGESASFIQGGVPILDGPNAGVPAVGGAQVFPGFQTKNKTDKSRVNFATYVDLENKLTNQLLLELAGRYEYYDDFGSTITGKLAAAYQPSDQWVFRASTSTGFRAPALAQSHFTSTATTFVGGDPFEIGTFPVNHPLSRALGANDLKPEKSLHFGAGFSYQPTHHLLLSADLFFTEIKDRIVLSSNINQDSDIFGLEVAGLLQSFGVGGARFFTNALDTQTQGLDLSARYDWDLDRWGSIILSAQYHANKTEIQKVNLPALFDNRADSALTRRDQERIESGQARSNLIFSANYQFHRFHIMMRLQRFGSVHVVPDSNDPSLDQKVDARWLTDLDLSYQINQSLALALGGNNIFNVYPKFVTTLAGNPFSGNGRIFPYPGSGSSPFGANGSFYYLRVKYEFD